MITYSTLTLQRSSRKRSMDTEGSNAQAMMSEVALCRRGIHLQETKCLQCGYLNASVDSTCKSIVCVGVQSAISEVANDRVPAGLDVRPLRVRLP